MQKMQNQRAAPVQHQPPSLPRMTESSCWDLGVGKASCTIFRTCTHTSLTWPSQTCMLLLLHGPQKSTQGVHSSAQCRGRPAFARFPSRFGGESMLQASSCFTRL